MTGGLAGICIFLVKRGVADRDSFVILIVNSLRSLCLTPKSADRKARSGFWVGWIFLL